MQFKQIEILITNNCLLPLLKNAQWLKNDAGNYMNIKAKGIIILTYCNTQSFFYRIQVFFTGFSGSDCLQTYVFRLQDLNTPSLCIYPSPWQPLDQRRLIEPVLDKVLVRKKQNKSMTSTCSCKVK